MKFEHLTWYLLEGGTQADPNDVAPDDKGVLVHKSGRKVAMRDGGVPMTIGRAAVENKNVEAAHGADADPAKELKPESGKRPYKTREAKAE